MRLALIAESINENQMVEFLSDLAGFELLNSGDAYIQVVADVSVSDLKSKVLPAVKKLEWYPRQISLGRRKRRLMSFAPVKGKPIDVPLDNGNYVYHVPQPKYLDKIKSSGLELRGYSGKSGETWGSYPPRIFVWTSVEAIGHVSPGMGIPENTIVCAIDPTGIQFYVDEQYQNNRAAYALDPILAESIVMVPYSDLKGRGAE